ncbi:hypothetical protein POM88_016189 [Heracleum sosnowskyi]|uniref:Uncharacterized protein n=1 Tax=Heracleum sosnowskyi TaxID=360622 RepID=A0AAD8IM42_9APIA|nr:hypothetical protein POM88_016189 [Heracleum sosnowskyi]
MHPPQSYNRINSKNQKNDVGKTQFSLKDGSRSIGATSKSHKRSTQSAVVMDGHQRNDILIEAARLKEEKGGRDSNNEDFLNEGLVGKDSGDVLMEESIHHTYGIDGSHKINLKNDSPVVLKRDGTVMEGKTDGKGNVDVANEGRAGQEEGLLKAGRFKVQENSEFVEDGNAISDKQENPWTEMFKSKVNLERLKFEYHCPEFDKGRVVIRPLLSVDIQGCKAWENCIVGLRFLMCLCNFGMWLV